jgi:nucleotide-binding universal stress UspA family protein
MPAVRPIAVAIDGSKGSERALDRSIELARTAAAPLTIVGVVPRPERTVAPDGAIVEIPLGKWKHLAPRLERYAQEARRRGVKEVTVDVRQGRAVDQLVTFIEDRSPDILVMGARGLSHTKRLLLGGVSDAVVRRATCSVLVVRPSPHH